MDPANAYSRAETSTSYRPQHNIDRLDILDGHFASSDDNNDLSPGMSERRFNEAEVAAIFERAAEAQQSGLHNLQSGEGMTLTDLQDIGREVGISREQLALAAKAIELGGRPTSSEFLGLPVGVGLIIDLGRKLSDDEWDRFVVDRRETFDARGTLRSEGSLRHWANGNLQAHLEPTATGHRIRLRTVKGDARGLIIGGLGMLGFATGDFRVGHGSADDRWRTSPHGSRWSRARHPRTIRRKNFRRDLSLPVSATTRWHSSP